METGKTVELSAREKERRFLIAYYRLIIGSGKLNGEWQSLYENRLQELEEDDGSLYLLTS